MADDVSPITELNARIPCQYGSGDLFGLGNFILNLTENPGSPDTDAENICLAVLAALEAVENEAYAKAATHLEAMPMEDVYWAGSFYEGRQSGVALCAAVVRGLASHNKQL